NIIRNIRATIADPEDKFARSELIWAAAMAENGILKIGKVTDFQCHMIEHQLGAYTDCNHGQGLAVIHPVLYRHIYKENTAQFARLAQNVWGISPDGRTEEQLALAGIEALADFISEIGLPTKFTDMGISADTDFRAIADSTVITKGCCKKLAADEIFEILKECV
ncbi:MAG: iron-containing alcohol dehydrogenase, partial [Ruminococcus sp.]|nr:iron-containing alcohol dehydrogenase [Ruminococcus sp.]